jgi:hypothetical protein
LAPIMACPSPEMIRWAALNCLWPIFHEWARQKECRIVQGHLLPDHVHIWVEIPPKYAAAFIGAVPTDIVLEELSDGRKQADDRFHGDQGPRYDHRLRHLVQGTGA